MWHAQGKGCAPGAIGVEAFRAFLARGESAALEVDRFDTSGLAAHKAALIRDFVSLNGTTVNCAGGISYRGRYWLTCEETEQRRTSRFLKDHGYVFEVDPVSREANTGRSPVPLAFLGR